MAIDFYLNPLTGDIDLTNQTMKLTSSIEESSRQQVLIDLRTYLGEWVFNISSAGVPYLKNDNNSVQLLGKNSVAVFDSYIRQSILGRENITEILSYSSDLDVNTRVITVSFEALTNTGDVVAVVDETIL